MASIFSHFLVIVMLALTQIQSLTAEDKRDIGSTKNLKPESVIKTDNLKSWNKRTSNVNALNALRQAVARGPVPRAANRLDNPENLRLLQAWLWNNAPSLISDNPMSYESRASQDAEDEEPEDTWDSMHTWGKRSPSTWDSMAAWGKRNPNTWDSMAAWGKRNGDTWDSMSAWGKRSPNTWDSMSAWGKRSPDTWDSMSAWGKRDDNTWDSMSAWGKRNSDTWDSMSAWGKRGNTWDSMSAWGKRSGDTGAKRDWDSLNAWGKRGKDKKDWDSLAAWRKRNINGAGNQDIDSQVKSLMKRSSGKNSKSRR